MEIVSGTVINDRYKVLSKLGTGGMGTVYLVEDLELHSTKRALKLLHSHIAKELRQVERFRQEMTLACELSHPNIIRFFEFGETPDGQYFMTMEYFEGQNLGDILDSPEGQAGLPFNEVLPILYYVAGALHHIHSKNIIHRDIKPSNILIGKDGTVKLTDLGIAKSLISTNKITRTNEMVGTSSYMSPERFTGLPIDHRTDIYSFGITAFELLTGKQPFDDENYVRLMAMHLSEPIPKLTSFNKGLPSWLQRFIENCCEKKADQRFQSMAEVARKIFQHITKMGLEVKSISTLIGNVTIGTGGKSYRRGPLLKGFSILRRGWGRIRLSVRNFLIAIVIGYLHLFLMTPLAGFYYSGLLGQSINLKIMDLWFNWRGRIDPPKDVVVISVDEKSHEVLGASTKEAWPRQLTAELLEKLAEHNPKKIFLDFVYSELGDPIEDTRLAMAMALSPTYLAENIKKSERVKLDGSIENIQEKFSPNEFFLKSARDVFIADVSRGNILPFQGGDIVRYFQFYKDLGFKYPVIAYPLLGDQVERYKLPTINDFINFYGPPGSVISVPIYKVIKGIDIPDKYFNQKYIFVGRQLHLPYLSKQTDTFLTPFLKSTAGVEVHATIAANILTGNYISRPELSEEQLFSFILSTFVAMLVLAVHPKIGVFVAIVFAIIAIVITFMMFGFGWFIPAAALVVTVVIAYMISLLRLAITVFPLERILGVG